MWLSRTPSPDDPDKFYVSELCADIFLRTYFAKTIAARENPYLAWRPTLIRELSRANIDDIVQTKLLNALDDLYAAYSEPSLSSTNHCRSALYKQLAIALCQEGLDVSLAEESPHFDALFFNFYQTDAKVRDALWSRVLDPSWYLNTDCTQSMVDRLRVSLGKKTYGIFREDGSYFSFLSPFNSESNVNKLANGLLGLQFYPVLERNIGDRFAPDFDGRYWHRLGTQIIQEYMFYISVPGMFKNYLRILNKQENSAERRGEAVFVYFNLLKRTHDSERADTERGLEEHRSAIIHQLETEVPGVFVITLPADNAFFFENFDKHSGEILCHYAHDRNFETIPNIFHQLVQAILKNSHDFYFSNDARKILFGDPISESSIKTILAPHFNTAVSEIIGRDHSFESAINMAERQAILFNFIKNHLTQFILDMLDPAAYSIVCKDGIDRAGVHNSFRYFTQRIEHHAPILQRNFEEKINAAAVLVKDRPINEHFHALVNTLGYYYFHLNEEARSLAPWMPNWLDNNSHFKAHSRLVFEQAGQSQKMAPSDFFIRFGAPVNRLYREVAAGDLAAVESYLETAAEHQSWLSIWDNDQRRWDTVLNCAATKGNFDIFTSLIRFHARYGILSGLRTQRGRQPGDPLTRLFRHLHDHDIPPPSAPAETERLPADSLLRAIHTYMHAITVVQPPTVKQFVNYTSVPDEDNLTAMDYLAMSGRTDLLDYLHQLLHACDQDPKRETQYPLIFSQFFDLSRTNPSMLELAAKGGHVGFLQRCQTLDEWPMTSPTEQFNQLINRATWQKTRLARQLSNSSIQSPPPHVGSGPDRSTLHAPNPHKPGKSAFIPRLEHV